MGTGEARPETGAELTALLEAWRAGDGAAAERVVPLVYSELHRMAAGYLAAEGRDHTLQPTALVHEAYLRLSAQGGFPWRCRSHFFAVASQVVRRILVDHARKRRSAKRGRGRPAVSLSEARDLVNERPEALVELDAALEALKVLDPQQATIVELRFFGGLTAREAAEVLGCSASTVHRQWRLARSWLYRELSGGP